MKRIMSRRIYVGPIGSRLYAPCGESNWTSNADESVHVRIVQLMRCANDHSIPQMRGCVFVAFMHVVGPGDGCDFADAPEILINDFVESYHGDGACGAELSAAVQLLHDEANRSSHE